MNNLRQSVRICAVLTRSNALMRPMSSSSIMKDVFEVLETKKISNFDTVVENQIHRMNCVEDMGKLLYPGSLSTVPKGKEEYLTNRNVELRKLIDFDCKQAKNQLTFTTMKCPTILMNELKRASQMAEFLRVHIVQLSYENYDDLEQGRKDCVLAANEIVIRLSALNRWAYFSASATPVNPDDGYFCLFKSKITDVKPDFATNLHAQVTSEDGCVKISYEPFDKSVGIIYTNVTKSFEMLRLLSAFEKPFKEGDKMSLMAADMKLLKLPHHK